MKGLWYKIKNLSTKAYILNDLNLEKSLDKFSYDNCKYPHNKILNKHPHNSIKFDSKHFMFTRNPVITEVPSGKTLEADYQYIEVIENKTYDQVPDTIHNYEIYNMQLRSASIDRCYKPCTLKESYNTNIAETRSISKYLFFLSEFTDNKELNNIILQTFMGNEHYIFELNEKDILKDFISKYCIIIIDHSQSEDQFYEFRNNLFYEYEINIE